MTQNPRRGRWPRLLLAATILTAPPHGAAPDTTGPRITARDLLRRHPTRDVAFVLLVSTAVFAWVGVDLVAIALRNEVLSLDTSTALHQVSAVPVVLIALSVILVVTTSFVRDAEYQAAYLCEHLSKATSRTYTVGAYETTIKPLVKQRDTLVAGLLLFILAAVIQWIVHLLGTDISLVSTVAGPLIAMIVAGAITLTVTSGIDYNANIAELRITLEEHHLNPEPPETDDNKALIKETRRCLSRIMLIVFPVAIWRYVQVFGLP